MKRILYVTLLLSLACMLPAQTNTGIEFSIRFYDEAIYFAQSTVQIKLEIYNNSPETMRFKLAENHFFSVDFDVRSVSNVPADRARSYVVARSSDNPVYFREVNLEPGERFGFVESLNDYIKIPGSGVYVIRGRFYPELFRTEGAQPIVSNALTLTIHPGTTESEQEVAINIETGEILRRAALPPDEIVSFVLSARQHGNWDQFFLYVDLESLYLRTSVNANQYERLSETERRRVLKEYRDNLTNSQTSDEILLVPTSFNIEKTTYTTTDATVVVVEHFAYPTFSEVKEYTYYLYRTDRVWLITDYAVRNLGTE